MSRVWIRLRPLFGRASTCGTISPLVRIGISGRRIIARAREGDLLIQMGYMFRYHDGYRKIAEWVHSGFLGDVFAVRAHMSTFLGKVQKERVVVHQGGVFFDLCGHQLDQVVHLLGRPERVTPFLRDDMREVEGFTDNGVGIFEFEPGDCHCRYCGAGAAAQRASI